MDRPEVATGERPDVSDCLRSGGVQLIHIQNHDVARALSQGSSSPMQLAEDPLVVSVDPVETRDDQWHRGDHDPSPVDELGLDDDDQYDTGCHRSHRVDHDAPLPTSRRIGIEALPDLEPVANHATL